MSKKSIINSHYGQAGVQTGWETWKLYCHEHGIFWDGTRQIPEAAEDFNNFETFFYETSNGRYVPKAIFIDSEPSVLDALRCSPLGQLLHEECMLNGTQGCRNMMGLAYFSEFSSSADVQRRIPGALRKMNEACDKFSGYMHFLSSCGGSGPGYCCKALDEIRKSRPKSINQSYTLTPSPSISQNPLETYNTIMFHSMIRFDNLGMNINTIFDNEALYRQSIALSNAPRGKFVPTYKHLNELIAVTISSATASIRWDGQLNVDLEDFQVNLVPYPTMHHLFHVNSPLLNKGNKDRLRVRDLTLQAFKPAASCVSVWCIADAIRWPDEEDNGTWPAPIWISEHEQRMAYRKEKDIVHPPHVYAQPHAVIGCCLMYRGDVMPVKVNQAIRELQDKVKPYFVRWVPNGFKVGINSPRLSLPADWDFPDQRRSLLGIMNSTAILEKFKQLVADYTQLRELEAYDSWFSQGFDPELMEQCKEGFVDLIVQYEAAMSRDLEVEEMRDAMEARPSALDSKFANGAKKGKR